MEDQLFKRIYVVIHNYHFNQTLIMLNVFSKTLTICFVILIATVNSFACEPEDTNSIEIIAINNVGIDFVVVCNSSLSPVSLTGMILLVDNDPNNTEILGAKIIPAESCIRLVRDVDFSFTLENDDSFTISCDGTIFATASSIGSGLTVFDTAPTNCNSENAASISITGIVTGTGVDRVIVCNSSGSEIVLSGASVSNIDNSSDIPFLIIPANDCVTLIRNLDFFFGLNEGSDDSFTITCGETVMDSQSWTPADLGPNGEISFGLEPCIAGLAPGSIFISSIVVDSSIVDQVVICNSTAEIVSLDGADIVDSGNDGTNPQLELLVGLTIQPYSCITLISEIDFTFGLSSHDSFSISCMGNIIVAEEWEENMLNSTGALLFLQDPPVIPLSNTIPTIGEWGLVSLCLLFLVFATNQIREERLVIS